MTGGHDTVIPLEGRAPSAALDLVTRSMLTRWPQALVEDAEGTVLPRYRDIAFSAHSELFIYRDEPMRLTWHATGAHPANEVGMIHVIVTDLDLTLVTGSHENPETHRLVCELSQALNPLSRSVEHAR